MPSSRPAQPAPLRVAIVCRSRETLDGLEAYLARAGVATSGTRQIERSGELSTAASAIVLFPDDFKWDAVVAALTDCRRRSPGTFAVLVTNGPQRFEALTWPSEGAAPLVVPKPVWGWTILDAIRVRLADDSGSEPER